MKFSAGILLFSAGILITNILFAQDSIPIIKSPFILFPSPEAHRNWKFSVGIKTTTTPEDITEETNFRIPCADFIAVRRISSALDIRCRLLVQVVQNQVTIGPRWSHSLSKKMFFAIGNDLGYWRGQLNIDEFDTRGYGLFNYPNLSLGYKPKINLLFTFKCEAILNLYDNFQIGRNEVSSLYDFFSGSAYTIAIEQPFYKKRYVSLAFTALYANFFWQTWTLYNTYDRNYFYPQISIGFIL